MATLQLFYFVIQILKIHNNDFVIPYLLQRLILLQENTYPDFNISEIYYIKDPNVFMFCDSTRAELEKQLPKKKGRVAAKRK